MSFRALWHADNEASPWMACPRCGAPAGHIHADWECDSAICVTCGDQHKISALTGWEIVPVAKIDLATPPTGCGFARTSDGFQLTAPALRDDLSLLIVFVYAVLLVAMLTYGGRGMPMVFFSLFLAFGLLTHLPLAVMSLFGRYELRCRSGQLTVMTMVGPAVARWFRISEPYTVRLRRGRLGLRRGVPSVAVELHGRHGDPERFGIFLSHAARAFVVRALRDWRHAPPPVPQ